VTDTWKKELLSLLLLGAFLSVIPKVSSAVVYTEEFTVGDSNTDMNTVGWSVYLKNDSGGVDDLSNHTLNLSNYEPAGIADYTSDFAFVVPRTHTSYDNADGPGLLFTTEPTTTLSTTDIGSLSALSVSVNADGSAGDQALGRFAIQIGGQWYASASSVTSTSNNGPTGAFSTFQVNGITFTDGDNWHLMTATTGVSGDISVGALAGGTLSGSIQSFGFYQEYGNNGDHFRIDDYSVTVVPEPTSIGITSLALMGFFYYSRKHKAKKQALTMPD